MKLNHLLHTFRSSGTALLAAISLAGITTANAASFFDSTIAGINLGNASGGNTGNYRNWAVFALSGGVTISDSVQNNSWNDVAGNVGVGGSGNLTMTLSRVKGTAYFGNQANKWNGGGTITGGVSYTAADKTYLATAVTNANSATAAAALLATVTTGLSVSGSTPAAVLTGSIASPALLSLNNQSGGITGVSGGPTC